MEIFGQGMTSASLTRRSAIIFSMAAVSPSRWGSGMAKVSFWGRAASTSSDWSTAGPAVGLTTKSEVTDRRRWSTCPSTGNASRLVWLIVMSRKRGLFSCSHWRAVKTFARRTGNSLVLVGSTPERRTTMRSISVTSLGRSRTRMNMSWWKFITLPE